MRLLVPGYVYPDVSPHYWDQILQVAPIVDSVIVNVDSGVGDRHDPVWAQLAETLHRRGIRCLGYVWVGYGVRPWHEIQAEAQTWHENYGVEGLFLDGVPPLLGPSEAPKMIALRRQGASRIVANPGVPASGSAVTHLDMIVDWEGTNPPRSLPAMSDGPHRAWIGHGVVGWRRALRRAARSHAETVWLTDRSGPNPYDGLPSFWGELTRLLASAESITTLGRITPRAGRPSSGTADRRDPRRLPAVRYRLTGDVASDMA